jgi:hypothetical protein
MTAKTRQVYARAATAPRLSRNLSALTTLDRHKTWRSTFPVVESRLGEHCD